MVNVSLFSVTAAGILAYIPHIMRVILATRAAAWDNGNPREQPSLQEKLTPEQYSLYTRLSAAHSNQLETLGLYAAGIAAAYAAGSSQAFMNSIAGVYVFTRILYVIVYALPPIAGGYLRTAVFFPALASIIVLWTEAARQVVSKTS